MTYTHQASWKLEVGNAYIVNDGRVKVEMRFPGGSWKLPEFVAMVEKAGEGWETVIVNWFPPDYDNRDGDFLITALRQPTEEDRLNIEKWRLEERARHQRDLDYHRGQVEKLS